VKHCRLLYGIFTVLGIVILTWLLASIYLISIEALIVLPSFPSSELGAWSVLLVGIAFLTVGMVGLGRQHFKNQRNLLTVLVVFLVPSLTFATVFFTSVLMVAPIFPVRDEITQVGIVNNNPLVLYLGVKAITSGGTNIDSVLILNSHGTMMAEYHIEEFVTVDEKGDQVLHRMPICTLSGGSSMTLTVRFNCTLPPGNYTVRLTSWSSNHGSSPFTIP